MTGAHTPGPWVASVSNAERYSYTVDAPGPWPHNHVALIPEMYGDDCRTPGAHTANAHLIAAAPTMLQALERLSAASLARDNVMGDPCALLAAKAELADANRAACEVIAQARGQS